MVYLPLISSWGILWSGPVLSRPLSSVLSTFLGLNWTCSATISVVYRFPPSLVSHDRVWIRPSTRSVDPFRMYCATNSAVLPKATQLWNWASSFFAPSLSFQVRFVAIEKEQTLDPARKRLELGVSGQVSVDLCVIYVHGFYWLE